MMVKANETAMMFADHDTAMVDRALLCKNLGWLLSQTRGGVIGCHYEYENQSGQEWCVIEYKHSDPERVNINHDSYMAIIRDVSKRI